MDIQASHSNNVHNILNVEGVQTTSENKNIYIPATTHSQTHPHQNQQHVMLQSNQDHTVGAIPNVQQQGQSAENILQGDTTIPLRNIKVDPETLVQPGQDQDSPLNQSGVQQNNTNFIPEIELGNPITSQDVGDASSDPNNLSSNQKDSSEGLKLKNESIGDFNAFHDQIQTVDPVLLWSMVRSRVVPQVSCWDFLCDKAKGAYLDEGDSKDDGAGAEGSSLRLQTYKLQVMVEQLKEVFNEMQILMLNCCEEEPLGKRFRKEDRKKKKRSNFGDGEDLIVKLEDPVLRKAFSSSSSTATGGAFRLKPEVPAQYHNIFNVLDHSSLDSGVNDNWSHPSSHFMVSGNGDTGGYLPLKCEYQSDIDDDDDDENDIPNENDFIAPIDYIDPATQTHQVDFKTMRIKLGKDGKPKKKTGPKPKNVVAPGGPFNCKDCGREFNNRRQVYKHRVRDGCRGTINPGPKKYKILNGHYLCLQPQCTSEYPEGAEILNTYSTREKFWKHIESVHSHPEDLLYTCDHCGKKFALKGMLKDHVVKVHDKPFVCRYCGTAFGEKATLKKHERTHTGEKPYKCEFCDFRSNSASSRSMHVKRKHDATGANKVHICELCGKGFVDKYHLKCHVLTHSSQKLFPCNLCGAHQKNDSCLRSHMMRVHGLKYMCDVCGKDFSATLGLKIHQREVHQIY